MSLNHTHLVQSLAQIIANSRPSTSAVIVLQPVQQATISSQTGSFNVHVLPPQSSARMPTFTMPVNESSPTCLQGPSRTRLLPSHQIQQQSHQLPSRRHLPSCRFLTHLLVPFQPYPLPLVELSITYRCQLFLG